MQSGSEAWWAGPMGLGRKLWVAGPAGRGPGSLAPCACGLPLGGLGPRAAAAQCERNGPKKDELVDNTAPRAGSAAGKRRTKLDLARWDRLRRTPRLRPTLHLTAGVAPKPKAAPACPLATCRWPARASQRNPDSGPAFRAQTCRTELSLHLLPAPLPSPPSAAQAPGTAAQALSVSGTSRWLFLRLVQLPLDFRSRVQGHLC